MKKLALALALILCSTVMVSAFDTTALELSIWAPRAQLVPPEIAVSGLKLNLPYGNNYQVTGLDLGLVSINRSQGDQHPASVSAIQVNLWNSTDGDFTGLQVGLVNIADNSSGIVVGLCNVTSNCARGLFVGLINSSLDFRGIAIGVVNYTQFLTGIQIGLVNIATESTLPFFPIINMCF